MGVAVRIGVSVLVGVVVGVLVRVSVGVTVRVGLGHVSVGVDVAVGEVVCVELHSNRSVEREVLDLVPSGASGSMIPKESTVVDHPLSRSFR